MLETEIQREEKLKIKFNLSECYVYRIWIYHRYNSDTHSISTNFTHDISKGCQLAETY